MKYWIASYPRSGNTFFRILLQEVYGIKTWEGYGDESPQKVIDFINKTNSGVNVFIKTHDLPTNTELPHQQLKAIYLVRDGRDAAVSMAYHRKNIVKPGSDYLFNLRAGILSPFDTSFGGWSKHVNAWTKQTDIIIKFENLIANPKLELQKLEKHINLPKGDYSKIPTFKDLKSKNYGLGSGNNELSEAEHKKRRENFFREGKTKTYIANIPKPLISIFNHKHGEALRHFGYKQTQVEAFIHVKIFCQYLLAAVGYIKEVLKL